MCATVAAASAPTACSSASRPTDTRRRMILFNADGSRAEMSGNGIRCFAQALASRRGDLEPQRILTDAGERLVTLFATDDPTRSRPRSRWARSSRSANRRAGASSVAIPIDRSPTSASATRTASSASTTSPPSIWSTSGRWCRTSTSRSSSPVPSRTRSRCASTNVAPASPRPAERAPAPRRSPPLSGASFRRAFRKSWCRWTAGVPQWRSTARPGRTELTGPATYVARIEIEIEIDVT